MDGKTGDLHEIFVEATGGEQVLTEEQSNDTTGTRVVNGDAEDEEIREVIAEMRVECAMTTALSYDALVDIVRMFHRDTSDEEIAAELGITSERVCKARCDLHLFRDSDSSATLGDQYQNRIAEASGTRFQQRFKEMTGRKCIGSVVTDSVLDDGLDEAITQPETN